MQIETGMPCFAFVVVLACCFAILPRGSVSQNNQQNKGSLTVDPDGSKVFYAGGRAMVVCLAEQLTKRLVVRYSPSSRQPATSVTTGFTPRHTVVRDLSGSPANVTLIINPVALSDAGTYYCVDQQNLLAIATTLFVVPKPVEPEPMVPNRGGGGRGGGGGNNSNSSNSSEKATTTIEACGIYFNQSLLFDDVLQRNLTAENATLVNTGDVITKFDTTYVLACRFRLPAPPTSNSSVKIYWLRNGQLFDLATIVPVNGSTDANITVMVEFKVTKNTRLEDVVGLFHLNMNGTIVNTDTTNYPLNIYTTPITSLTRSTWEAFSGSATTIDCIVDKVVEQNVYSTAQWLIDGQHLQVSNVAGARFSYKQFPDEDNPFWTVRRLLISDLKSSDRHWYTCVGEVYRLSGSERSLISQSESRILLRVRDRLGALWPFIGILLMGVVLAVILYADDYWAKQREDGKDQPDGVDETDGGVVETEEDLPADYDEQRLKELLSGTFRRRLLSTPLGSHNGSSEKKPLLADGSDADLRQKLHGTSI